MVQGVDQDASSAPGRPSPGVQYHEYEKVRPKTDIAQASGVPHYLVPFSWYQKFIGYIKDGTDTEPPELDLDDLDMYKDGGELRADLRIGRDVQILQAESWSKIQQWYGKEDEYCVRHSYKLREGVYVIEYRPTDYYFSLYTPPSSFTELKKLSMFKYRDVEGLYAKVHHAFNIDTSHQIRFWHTTPTAGLTNLNNAREAIIKTHNRVNIGTVTDGSTSFIVETRKDASEKWQLETCKKAQVARGRQLGTKGLSNLGNTCYMASALQCVSHVKELSEYFLSGCYTSELNLDNPLGYSGRVATAFAKLLSQMFADDNQRAIAPRELKTVLGNINQSFGGYQQQDSQELLAFLLDALHEDLNRIVSKPATERPDIGDVSDEELLRLGEEAWRIHKLRNDSVIVDLFQGIYKSTLVCPVCSHVSITFDPFSDLSLPLPFRSYWYHEIYYVPQTGLTVKMTLEFEQNASIGQLISYLSKRFGVPPNRIAGAEVWKHKFYKIYENYMPVTTIEKSDDAYFYELTSPDPRTDRESADLWVPVYTYKRGRHTDRGEECAVPFPIILSKQEIKSYRAIQQKLLLNYSRFTTSLDLVKESSVPVSTYSQDPSELTGSTAASESDLPFVIKVGQHRIGSGSFYGGKEPTLLTDRMPKPATSATISRQESGPISPSLSDDMSYHGGLKRAPAPSETQSSDVVERTIAADLGPGADQAWKASLSNDDDDEQRLPSEDIGMKDDSDDDMIRLPGYNADLVDRLLTRPTSDTATTDSIPTPVSKPASPLDDDSSEISPEDHILLRPQDAIYCEWPEASYDEIFSEDENTIGGRSRWSEYDVQLDEVMEARRDAREGSKNNIKSLEDCLDEFAKEEPLDAENTWYCPKCKEHQRANKTFELWRSGDILVFHLKRFSSSRSLSDKIDAEIQFPVRGLNLNERLGERKMRVQKGATDLEDAIYDLTGVVNHYGGLGGGHYTAFAQTFDVDGYRDFHNFNGKEVYTAEQ